MHNTNLYQSSDRHYAGQHIDDAVFHRYSEPPDESIHRMHDTKYTIITANITGA